MKKILLFIIAMTATISLNAQGIPFDVKGLKIGSKVNTTQIKKTLGNPKSIESSMGETVYNYGETGFTCIDGVFLDAFIKDSSFPVFTNIISGGIKVGETETSAKNKIKNCQQLSDCLIEPIQYCKDTGFMVGKYDDWVNFVTDKNGKIVLIIYNIIGI